MIKIDKSFVNFDDMYSYYNYLVYKVKNCCIYSICDLINICIGKGICI